MSFDSDKKKPLMKSDFCTPNDTIIKLFLPKPNRHLRFKGTALQRGYS